MKIGMLWFDNDPKADLATKIDRAAQYFITKYGDTPNLCYVHPTQVNGTSRVNNIEVKSNRSVLPNHLWIGVDNRT